ncbi:innexin unc-9-like [Ylistrum balloti]|uniref:innexin unc-9-like n=1 Tax=Ylistrum balloti TaxID=509963 RepID=UPI002905C351|nr:innexin unc-9-like [Ylistrum balloti]
MSELLGFVPSFSKLRGKPNDDWIDRMSHVYTVVVLVIFTVLVSSGQFFKDPIQCWHPAEFKDSMESYTKWNCWVKNTYYVPMSDIIPEDISSRQEAEITYYQWVPLILLFQAFLFKFPNMVWRIFNGGSGLNLDKVVRFAEKTQMVSPADRDDTINCLAKFMDKWLDSNKEHRWNVVVRTKHQISRFMCFFCNKRAGKYLTAMYLFVKVLYVANAIGQLFLLNAFMSTSYNFYGFEFLDNLNSDRPWRESPRFPRITLCDFQIRQLQNIQRFTVQCVLPINLFNEKVFIFIWFWLIFIAVLACINLFRWLYLIVFAKNKVDYVKKYLKINNELHTNFDKKMCTRFAENYLRDDGVFVLRLVAKNSTDIVVTDLVRDLWKIFKEKQSTKKNELEPTMENNFDDAKEKEPLT